MFVAISQYLVGLEEVDRHRDDHKAWLAVSRDAGRVTVFGRQVPPEGGVIVFDVADRGEVEALIATDPYVVAGVARYELTQFEPPLA